jgi:hypothetical protein
VTITSIFAFNIAALIVAQTSPQWGEVAAQTGVAVTVLGWFMFRLEGQMKELRASNDRLAKASLLLVLSLNQASATAKDEARGIIRDIDDSRPKSD